MIMQLSCIENAEREEKDAKKEIAHSAGDNAVYEISLESTQCRTGGKRTQRFLTNLTSRNEWRTVGVGTRETIFIFFVTHFSIQFN